MRRSATFTFFIEKYKLETQNLLIYSTAVAHVPVRPEELSPGDDRFLSGEELMTARLWNL